MRSKYFTLYQSCAGKPSAQIIATLRSLQKRQCFLELSFAAFGVQGFALCDWLSCLESHSGL